MSILPPTKSANDVPMPLAVGSICFVVMIIGIIAWRTFGPITDPLAGMTLKQRIARARKARADYVRRHPESVQHGPFGILIDPNAINSGK